MVDSGLGPRDLEETIARLHRDLEEQVEKRCRAWIAIAKGADWEKLLRDTVVQRNQLRIKVGILKKACQTVLDREIEDRSDKTWEERIAQLRTAIEVAEET